MIGMSDLTPLGGPIEPSEKSPQIEHFLKYNFGFDRRDSISTAKCIPIPYGCGKPLVETNFAQSTGSPQDNFFRDQLSAKEYTISGLCQDCQDDFFKESPDMDG